MNLKAQRLLVEDRVREAEANVYVVEGDTGLYITTVLPIGTGFCTCPHGLNNLQPNLTAGQGCAHLQAAYAKSIEGYLG